MTFVGIGGSVKLQSMQKTATRAAALTWGSDLASAASSALDKALNPNPVSGATNGPPPPPDDPPEFLGGPMQLGNNPNRRLANAVPVSRQEWIAWTDVRGTGVQRGESSDASYDMKGQQIDFFAGLTHRASTFAYGILGGYETFHYTSDVLAARLHGNAYSLGGYYGWRFAPNLRLEGTAAWSRITANNSAFDDITLTNVQGDFSGDRLLVGTAVIGTYGLHEFILEPEMRINGVWERDNSYTDSSGTLQDKRSFSEGRTSFGTKVSYPITVPGVTLAPYVGAFADYYFSHDSSDTMLPTTPLLDGWSARLSFGVGATLPSGLRLNAGGEFGGIGNNTHLGTWMLQGQLPF
jgi:outer membrane autotransporter protein